MALVFARQNESLSLRTYSDALDQYTAAFTALAKAEGVELMDDAKLRRALSKYSIEEIERAYDACSRFGMRDIYRNL